ncbi:AbrB family transcriptional regulator [Sodalis ligni]|jgi:membrane AbrB-like protein|uniref:Membrane AbrB-like protein n=2 Tax=Sodalis ligni TaxID=2697027 RepID=A0A4R1N9X9_9GAMM|nr:membrane AbrB-like protein [Sodalis ligni]
MVNMTIPQTSHRFAYLSMMLLLSALIGAALEAVDFKLGWMFGGVCGAALTSYFLMPAMTLSGKLYIGNMRQAGQAILGGGIGCLLHFSDIGRLGWFFFDIFFMMVISLISSFVLAVLYSLISTRQTVKTTFFSTLPGGIGIMANLAKEYGANAELVAILQSVRILSVVVFIPFLLRNLLHIDIDAIPAIHGESHSGHDIFSTVLILLFAMAGYYMGKKLHIASPSLIGPMLLAIIVNNLMPGQLSITMPSLLSHIAQILLGVTIGHGIISRLFFIKLRDLIIGLFSIVLLLLFAVAIAALFRLVADVDWQTAILSTAPGGAAEMIVLAKTLNTHLEIVVTAQVVRQIMVNALVPLWVVLSDRMENVLRKGAMDKEI